MISERLEITTGRSLLVAFWGAFFLCALATAVPRPYWFVAGGVTQLALLSVWVGYPLAVYWCFTSSKSKVVVLSLLIAAPILGGAVARATENLSNAGLGSLLGFALFLAPFVAAASALRVGESVSFGRARTAFMTACVSFLLLPFLGVFIHSRVRSAIRGSGGDSTLANQP